MNEEYTKENSVVLKFKRDAHVRNKHPWVFKGAINSYPKNYKTGQITPVLASNLDFLGYGYFNESQSISGRMIGFEQVEDPSAIILANLADSLALRKKVIKEDTNAYRLVNGEADGLPGLIVDRYDKVLVVQINTAGMEKQKEKVVKFLLEQLGDLSVYEKSSSQTRKKEGMEAVDAWISGTEYNSIEVLENGLMFKVSFSGMQKTGFFLDQREMRQLVKTYSKDKTVLNCFSYTGGFSIYALSGGAKKVDSVDLSESAIAGVVENLQLNNFSVEENKAVAMDVLTYFRDVRTATEGKQLEYDFIILDPPAFAKRSNDVQNASRGYRDINRAAMQVLPKGGLLLTSSCSSHVDRELFQTIIFQAAKDAKRNIKILSYHHLAGDHPVSLFYPEGDYLKSLLLYIE